MAEVTTNPRIRRRTLRVDFTPLVDLGFLLITFFVFTSTMSTPTAMTAMWPKDGDSTRIAESGAITIIPDAENIWYYTGDIATAQLRRMNANDMHQLRGIMAAAKQIHQEAGRLQKMMVVIKPSGQCNFKTVVDVLDEMTIGGVASYAITDLTAHERNILLAMQ